MAHCKAQPLATHSLAFICVPRLFEQLCQYLNHCRNMRARTNHLNHMDIFKSKTSICKSHLQRYLHKLQALAFWKTSILYCSLNFAAKCSNSTSSKPPPPKD
ncbi:hypothetical protein ACB092_05G080800 [Castanea dentata]